MCFLSSAVRNFAFSPFFRSGSRTNGGALHSRRGRSYESEISHSPAASDSVGGSVQDPSQYRTKRGRDSCHLVVAGGGHAEHLDVEKTVEAKRKVWTRSWGEEVQDTDQGDKGNFAKRIRTALPLEELVHWDDRKTLTINIIGNYITATILTLILVVDVCWTQQQNECRRLID
ncbi:hypothetical protein MCOR31_011223 [Pyricularia oryzae]|nr:hypothetical protein MCOR31_011223 [Pyricularia oryzae]